MALSLFKKKILESTRLTFFIPVWQRQELNKTLEKYDLKSIPIPQP